MKLDHIAIWTENPELLKDYYVKYLDGIPGERYTNTSKQFQSYFITFNSETRIEIMTKPDIPDNQNDTILKQHKGIIHLAFGVETMAEVDEKANMFKAKGFRILSGPRKTGDGYYEFETLDPDNNRIEITTNYVDEEFVSE
jgi:lactoylglutathione lyase